MGLFGFTKKVQQVSRLPGLDLLRGLAIVAMFVDHLTFWGVFDWGWLRVVPGRFAAPLFMLIAGSLIFGVFKTRWLYLGLVGGFMSILLPWAGGVGLFLIYMVGALIIWGIKTLSVRFGFNEKTGLGLGATFVLMFVVNGFGFWEFGLIAIMLVGALIGKSSINAVSQKVSPEPKLIKQGSNVFHKMVSNMYVLFYRVVCFLGRHPVFFYVTHLIVLDLLFNNSSCLVSLECLVSE